MSASDRHPGAATPLTLLGALRPLADNELDRLYAYPSSPSGDPTADPTRRTAWVRANFIASIDGGATVSGRSGGLAGPGDTALFALLRSLADVVLVGAGTVRVEHYSGVRLDAATRRARRNRGQSEIPPLAIVTRSGLLDADLPVFTRTEVAPLVLTCTAASDPTRDRLAGRAEVIDCSGADPSRVDETAVLAALTARGLVRVLTEGGPTLLSSFIERDLLDELCLTVAPFVVGGQARRIATGPGQVQTPMRRTHLLADEAGYLYARFVRTVDGVA